MKDAADRFNFVRVNPSFNVNAVDNEWWRISNEWKCQIDAPGMPRRNDY